MIPQSLPAAFGGELAENAVGFVEDDEVGHGSGAERQLSNSEELLAEIGNGDGDQHAHHPFQEVEVGFDWGEFDL